MNEFVILRHIYKRYGDSYALHDVSLTFPSKGLVGILGPSGSGKSTLLNILSGVDRKYMGSTVLLGKSLTSLNEAEATEFRLRNIGYVFQDFKLLDLEKVAENIRLPLLALYNEDSGRIKRKVQDLLLFVGLEKKRNKRVMTLSGGEKQRVAIARALANDPRLILADEPTGALDEKNAEVIFKLLRGISKNKLVIVVSHDEETLRKYADRLIHIEDGKIVKEEKSERSNDCPIPSSIRLKAKKEKTNVPLSFLYKHASSLIKAKKIRGYISNVAISVGMLGLGLATYIHSSIGEEVNKAVGGFVQDNTLIVKPVEKASSPISNTYSLELDKAKQMVLDHPEAFEGYGVSLKTDYGNVFSDADEVHFLSRSGTHIDLPYYRVENVNDFLFLDDEASVYPNINEVLKTNEIVLGLPYENMFRLCLELGIDRDFNSLGEYILYQNPTLVFDLANYGMDFADSEYLDIRGVVRSEVPCFYHNDRLWNHSFFVDLLNFHPKTSPNLSNAQEMFEVPYLSLKGDFSDFLKKSREEGQYQNLVYEYGNKDYLPSIVDDDHPLKEERIYLYSADKYGMPFTKMKEMEKKDPRILGREPIAKGSFFADTESVISGFSSNVFLSSSETMLEDICDKASIREKADADLPLSLPSEVVSGSLPYLGSGGFWIEAGKKTFDQGRAPSSIDEVGISSSLFEKWGSPLEVYIGIEKNRALIGGQVISDYSICPLRVSGIVHNDHDVIYVENDWTHDFFLTRAKISGFNLEAEGAVFYFSSKDEAKKANESLKEAFRDYRFFNPSEEVGSTVKEVTDYIGVVLIAFSFLALLMASLLFLVVMSITLEECKEEDALLHKLGISLEDRKKAMRMHALSYTLRSLVPSLAILLAMEVLVAYIISAIFGSSFYFSFSPIPLVSILVTSLLFYVFLSFCIRITFKSNPEENF